MFYAVLVLLFGLYFDQLAAFCIHFPLQGAVGVAGVNQLALRVVAILGLFAIAVRGFEQATQCITLIVGVGQGAPFMFFN